MAKPAPPPPVPEFTSDRLRLLGPLITPRVMELALMRFADSNAFFKSGKLQVPDEKSVIKVALVVVREMNPTEDWDDEEDALFTGVCSKTLRLHRAEEIEQLRMQVQRLVFRKKA